MSDATLDAGEVIATVLLDDLNDVQVGPEDVPRASHLARAQLDVDDLADGNGISCKPHSLSAVVVATRNLS